MKLIVGAGLTGLLAAHAWPGATVVDREPGPKQAHAALLRFRSDAVENLTGIEFRRVQVRKGIWTGQGFEAPNIRLANCYARKTMGRLDTGDRSIWNLEPVERYIAPEDFYSRLVEQVGSRIVWGSRIAKSSLPIAGLPFVTTIPLDVTLGLAELPHTLAFRRAPIVVSRFRVPRCDLFQTIYFPTNAHSCYRASITGDLLIIEHAGASIPPWAGDSATATGNRWLQDVRQAFGLKEYGELESLGDVAQSLGKIAPEPDDSARREALFQLTQKFGAYSLGRFAIWKNILLDDVVQDITVIKRMLREPSAYSRKLAHL